MEKEFVPYDRALKMKALGFDEPCFGSYVFGDKLSIKYCEDQFITESCCLAPTFSQAFRWIYDNYHEFEDISIAYGEMSSFNILYDEYRRLSCLDKLIEIVEKYK